jgi:hypothetical protein
MAMIVGMTRSARAALLSALGAVALIGSGAAPAQVQPVDPDRAIDGDLAVPQGAPSPQPTITPASVPDLPEPAPGATEPAAMPTTPANSTTYQKDDLIGAAEGVFGKGAAGLAGIIEDLLKKQGEPNGYITGREGGGALVVGCVMARAPCTTRLRANARFTGLAHRSGSMPGPMLPARLCWSTTSTIPKASIRSGSLRARGKPIWLAALT